MRPLTDDGQARFRRVVKRLAKIGWSPELVATSPLIRARQTADIIVERLADPSRLVVLDELAPQARLDELVSWTQQQPAEHVAWVGHAPDVGNLAGALIGDGNAWIQFAKGAVAAIEFEGAFGAGLGSLRWFVTAKTLGR